jgi:hypothetical protein
MEKSDLDKLGSYAASSRSQGFGGATYIKFDHKTGNRSAGKAGTDIAGRKLVADTGDAMAGFQRLESGQKPQYALVRILDNVDPIKRNELSDTNPTHWLDDNKDPWVPVTGLSLYDEETRQSFIFIAAYGARDAVADLLQAVVDHGIAHPEDADDLPLVEFCVREYLKNDGTTGYALYFEIDDWVDRAAVPHVRPPPLNITSQADKANGGGKATITSKSKSDKSTPDAQADAKPKRTISVPGGKPDTDDEIPF